MYTQSQHALETPYSHSDSLTPRSHTRAYLDPIAGFPQVRDSQRGLRVALAQQSEPLAESPALTKKVRPVRPRVDTNGPVMGPFGVELCCLDVAESED